MVNFFINYTVKFVEISGEFLQILNFSSNSEFPWMPMGISSEFSDEFPPSGQFFHELPASAGNFFTNCPLNFLFSENYRMFVWSQQEPLGPQLGPLWTKQKLSTFSFNCGIESSKVDAHRQSGNTSTKCKYFTILFFFWIWQKFRFFSWIYRNLPSPSVNFRNFPRAA